MKTAATGSTFHSVQKHQEPLKMPKRDLFRLPAGFRRIVNDRLCVLASVGAGRQEFVPVRII